MVGICCTWTESEEFFLLLLLSLFDDVFLDVSGEFGALPTDCRLKALKALAGRDIFFSLVAIPDGIRLRGPAECCCCCSCIRPDTVKLLNSTGLPGGGGLLHCCWSWWD